MPKVLLYVDEFVVVVADIYPIHPCRQHGGYGLSFVPTMPLSMFSSHSLLYRFRGIEAGRLEWMIVDIDHLHSLQGLSARHRQR